MHIRGFVAPMQARTIDRLPPSTRPVVFEPKLDGFRALAHVNENRGVQLYSRRGGRFNERFPEIMDAVFDELPAETVVDGEIVCFVDGRLDFGALQRRNVAGRRARELAAVQPCHLVLFDVLELGGVDHRSAPLTTRRALLEELFALVQQPSPLALAMHTTDPELAATWFDQLWQIGFEGLVIKPADSTYRTGDERTWLKYKRHTDTLAIVGGITGSLKRPEVLILARHDSDTGELRAVGRTARIDRANPAAAHELAGLLSPPDGNHPWPARLPPTWVGTAYGQSKPLDYVQVAPTVVVEVQVDAAAQGGRWRHVTRYRRARPDLTPDQVPLNLRYK